VRGYLVDGPDRADHAVHEHDQLEVILRELERVDPVDGRFPYIVMDLQTAFMEHIADEESQVFAQLRFAVPADELGRLGDDAEAVERSLGSAPWGPTVNDLLLLSVGAGPGMVDRLRALLEGRP
jgi:Hemerythrin HHE cation binding domain